LPNELSAGHERAVRDEETQAGSCVTEWIAATPPKRRQQWISGCERREFGFGGRRAALVAERPSAALHPAKRQLEIGNRPRQRAVELDPTPVDAECLLEQLAGPCRLAEVVLGLPTLLRLMERSRRVGGFAVGVEAAA
jgi:hypothetical protein